MTLRYWTLSSGFFLSVFSGCFTAQFEPKTDGSFKCQANAECQPTQFCVFELCQNTAPPRLQISSPEDETKLNLEALDPNADSFEQVVAISVVGGTSLKLVPKNPALEPVMGEGYLEVFVDGVLQGAPIEKGDLNVGVVTNVQVPKLAGPHRIRVAASSGAGTAYKTEGAIIEHILWVDDGKPRVAVKKPYAQASVSKDKQSLTVSVSAINFTFAPRDNTLVVDHGHVHIYYDKSFPDCAGDTNCDATPLVMIIPTKTTKDPISGTIDLPAAAGPQSTITAILRTDDHTPFLSSENQLVFDSVTLERPFE